MFAFILFAAAIINLNEGWCSLFMSLNSTEEGNRSCCCLGFELNRRSG